jgi:hypothetical protein
MWDTSGIKLEHEHPSQKFFKERASSSGKKLVSLFIVPSE